MRYNVKWVYNDNGIIRYRNGLFKLADNDADQETIIATLYRLAQKVSSHDKVKITRKDIDIIGWEAMYEAN